MPTTLNRCGRYSMPMGDSRPCGVMIWISSPTNAFSFFDSSRPMRMPSGCPSRGSSAARLPVWIDLLMLVTSFSRAGSTPLMVMKASLSPAPIMPGPSTTGAAPTTRGMPRTRATSAAGSWMPPILKTYTCAAEPTIRSRSSPWRPVISASAISSAMTPTVTPRIEIREMSEMNACLRRASR